MKTVLSTEALDPAERFESFQLAIRGIADLSAYRSATNAYSATIRKSQVGFLDCSFVDCDSVVIERDLANIDRDKVKDFLLSVQITGSGLVRHLGREMRLQEDDFLIVDSTLPYSIQFESPVRRMILRFPRVEFSQRGLVTEMVCGRVYSGQHGTSALASRVMRTLDTDQADLRSGLGNSLASAILDLIADSDVEDGKSNQPGFSQARDHILRRVRGIALANLSDPELSVSRIAEKAGISVRYLHKLFSSTGVTLHRWIEGERLDRCYRSLRSSKQRHRTIQEIALSNGFADSSYFSHRFFRRYGRTPSHARSEADVLGSVANPS